VIARILDYIQWQWLSEITPSSLSSKLLQKEGSLHTTRLFHGDETIRRKRRKVIVGRLRAGFSAT
jgi:hypothetical protein